METPRRRFLKQALQGSAAAALLGPGLVQAAANAAPSAREFYELRLYRLKPGAPRDLLDRYFERALLPALAARGLGPVGVFTENEPKDGPGVWLLVPYPTLDKFTAIAAELAADPTVQQAAADYLQAPKAAPAFDRIDSWLHLAFACLPRLEQPAFSRERRPRLFELRTYESHSELKALAKVRMFNSGEIDVMRAVGLSPVFYGQALAGRDLPHLSYMLSAENAAAHKQHWDAFKAHPTWVKMKADPQYADTVSKSTSRMLTPTAYSAL